MKTIKIAWNGVDSYIETDAVVYKQSDSWQPFDVVQIQMADVPLDADGELNFEGIYLTDAGNVYVDKEEVA